MGSKDERSVGAYVRVSSASQDAATQRDAIARVARARGDVVLARDWYSEKLNGGRMDRAELSRLRQDAREGKLRRLYIYRLDRLTRTGIRDTLDVVHELRRHGCEIVTVADGFDVAGPAADVVLAVLAWSAQMERMAIGERITAARARVEAQGGSWGRPERMTPDEQAKARALKDRGHSLRYIAQAVRVPKATVARCLKKVAKNAGAKGPRKAVPPVANGGAIR